MLKKRQEKLDRKKHDELVKDIENIKKEKIKINLNL